MIAAAKEEHPLAGGAAEGREGGTESGEEEEEGSECDGLPMRVCHLVAETAEENLLPHMVPLAKVDTPSVATSHPFCRHFTPQTSHCHHFTPSVATSPPTVATYPPLSSLHNSKRSRVSRHLCLHGIHNDSCVLTRALPGAGAGVVV